MEQITNSEQPPSLPPDEFMRALIAQSLGPDAGKRQADKALMEYMGNLIPPYRRVKQEKKREHLAMMGAIAQELAKDTRNTSYAEQLERVTG